MKSIRISDSYITRVVALEVKHDAEGKPKHDKTGAAQYTLTVLVQAKESQSTQPELVTITLTPHGGLPKLAPFSAVKLRNWVARPWQIGDRFGIAYSADGLEPLPAQGGSK